MNGKAMRSPADRPVLVGSMWQVKGEVATVIAIQGIDRVVVQDATGQQLVVRPGELTTPTDAEIRDSCSRDIAAIPAGQWEQARQLQADVDAVIGDGPVQAAQVDALAAKWGVARATAWRRIRRYRQERTLLAFVEARRGPRPGATLLSEEIEAIVASVARRWWSRTENATVAEIEPSIQTECAARGIPCPSRATIARRLRVLRADPENFTGEARAVMREKRRLSKSSYRVDQPLAVVQMDHTVADVFVVDPTTRAPIGRPTLTLAIDVATRCVMGMCLSLEAPSALLVALCLEHAVFPKDAWLAARGPAVDWPMYGRMTAIHTDNGKEFHGSAFRRGCDLNRIDVIYRPPATPRFGGHIERLIGTLMRKIRLLPGNSYSDVLRRRPAHAEKRAVMTLEDLRWYLCEQIARYHHRTHRALSMTPRMAWERGWAREQGIELPPLPADRAKFLRDFLPSARRVVGREGIELFGLKYSNISLAADVNPGHPRVIRYDPRDMSRVYLERPSGSYASVPLRDPLYPTMSLWEWRALRKRQRQIVASGDRLSVSAPVAPADPSSAAHPSALRRQRATARQAEWRALQAVQALPAPKVLTNPIITADADSDQLAWEVLE